MRFAQAARCRGVRFVQTRHGEVVSSRPPLKFRSIKSLADLPSKVLVGLLPHVQAKETLALEKTCKRFHKLIAENTAITQKHLLSVELYCDGFSLITNTITWNSPGNSRHIIMNLDYPERFKVG